MTPQLPKIEFVEYYNLVMNKTCNNIKAKKVIQQKMYCENSGDDGKIYLSSHFLIGSSPTAQSKVIQNYSSKVDNVDKENFLQTNSPNCYNG